MKTTRARSRAWNVHERDFWEIQSRQEQLRFLLQYAVLAPSGHNTQPWTFKILPEGVEVYADFSKALPLIDAGDRELLMSLGAAITNLRVAAAHFGFETTVVHLPRIQSSLPVALVKLTQSSAPDERLLSLFGAITRRHTNRHPFDGETIPPETVSALCDVADLYPQTLSLLLPWLHRQTADLVAFADRAQMASAGLRGELANWIRPSNSVEFDGICADALGVPPMASGAAAWLLRHFDVGSWQANRDRELVKHASLLMLVSADDDRMSLVKAGEILEDLLLTITKAGLHYSFMNQPIQVSELRSRVGTLSRCTRPPQLLLRIGHATAANAPMPRRPLKSVMMK